MRLIRNKLSQELCRLAVWTMEAVPSGEMLAAVGKLQGAGSTQVLDSSAGTPTR